jgi:Holliday junction resolvase RusA-like endonuclease
MNQWSSLHWTKKASYKKQVESLVWATCKSNKFEKFHCPVGINITGFFKSKRRRDIDNYSGGSTVKAILDGLVDANIITDDNTKYVEYIKIKLEQDTVNKIRVTIGATNGKNT